MLAALQLGIPQCWLPDETLFSLCSRYHRASGHRLASTTCRLLFGHPNQGSAHDFPARLDHFLSVAGDALGNVENIVEAHTVLPLYLRFANTGLVKTALSAAAESSSGRLKFQLGLLTSRFRANHPLKACLDCMDEDRQRHSTPYWHREHQLPGVWVCRRHGRWLQASDLKATGVSRFQWVLPTSAQLGQIPVTPPSSSAMRLARMVADLVSRYGAHIPTRALGLALRSALAERGLLAGPTRRMRHAAVGDAYAAFVAPLLELEQLGGLPASPSEAGAEVAKQLSPERSSTHPLRRLTLAAWLFDDLDELLARMKQAAAPTETAISDTATRAARTLDPSRGRFLDLLATGLSTSAAASAAGIDTTTGMVWAASAGLATPRRPKVLKGELRTQVVSLLRKGVPKEEAATYGKISIQTVTTLLRTEVGLHEAWRQASFENALQRHRRSWERIITANPLSGVKAARMAEPSVYAWLYRNDRDWLNQKTADMVRAVRAPKANLDWDTRDVQLADQVRKTALDMIELECVQRVKLHQLYQRIPELKAKLFKLDRLPLTRTAIFNVTGRTRSI
jgi:hypothetical protein